MGEFVKVNASWLLIVRFMGQYPIYTETKISDKTLILGFFLFRLKDKEMQNMALHDWNHDGKKWNIYIRCYYPMDYM